MKFYREIKLKNPSEQAFDNIDLWSDNMSKETISDEMAEEMFSKHVYLK